MVLLNLEEASYPSLRNSLYSVIGTVCTVLFFKLYSTWKHPTI